MRYVMIFKSSKALRHLLEHGFVFSFRTKQRKYLGKCWITDKRGGRKIINAIVEDVEFIYPFCKEALELYYEYSGFDSAEEWADEIIKLNRGVIPTAGWIYKVEVER